METIVLIVSSLAGLAVITVALIITRRIERRKDQKAAEANNDKLAKDAQETKAPHRPCPTVEDFWRGTQHEESMNIDREAMKAAMEEEWVHNEEGDYYCPDCATVDEATAAITLDESRRGLYEVPQEIIDDLTQDRAEAEPEVMSWEDKTTMAQLGNAITVHGGKGDFLRFVRGHLPTFDLQAWDMFLELIEITDGWMQVDLYKSDWRNILEQMEDWGDRAMSSDKLRFQIRWIALHIRLVKFQKLGLI